MSSLKYLDLSRNQLDGVIPRCLCSFTAMTKKGSLVIAYDYSLHIGSFVFDPTYPLEYIFVKQSHDPYQRGQLMLPSFSYVDRALVKWKRREFEYKNTLGLIKSIDLSSNKLSRKFPRSN
ncbi:hypothetical protein AAG906_019685 [Vitis piasezkii]